MVPFRIGDPDLHTMDSAMWKSMDFQDTPFCSDVFGIHWALPKGCRTLIVVGGQLTADLIQRLATRTEIGPLPFCFRFAFALLSPCFRLAFALLSPCFRLAP